MRRWEFIAGLGSAAAWSVAAGGQQRPVPAVGLLRSGSEDASAGYVAAFRRGLGETGYPESSRTFAPHWVAGPCQRATSARLLDHFVSGGEQNRWHG
jgi:putative tryptophan/tyrosine transport system substrate-binding protein